MSIKFFLFFIITLLGFNNIFMFAGGSKKSVSSLKKTSAASGAAAAGTPAALVSLSNITNAEFDKLMGEMGLTDKDLGDKLSAASAAGVAGAVVPLQPTYVDAFFSPGLAEHLKTFIGFEQEGIKGAVFEFTMFDVAQVLVAKADKLKKKVKDPVVLVVNKNFFEKKDYLGHALKYLAENNIKLWVNGHKRRFDKGKAEYEIMHNKFFIFFKNKDDKPLLWTGSFNVTGQANTNSWENVIITDDFNSIQKFIAQHELLVKYAKLLGSMDIQLPKGSIHPYTLSINGIAS